MSGAFKPVIYVAEIGEGEDAFLSIGDSLEEAYDNSDHAVTEIATYVLVKVERVVSELKVVPIYQRA